jgi:hypothetical protein
MPGSTLQNVIVQSEVSLALEHVLIAPVGTSYDRSKIDISSPPAGFIHLGAVADDSPSLQLTKAKYQLATGLPRVIAYEAVVALGGEFSVVLHSSSNLKAHFGMGGPRPRNEPVLATSATVVTADTLGRTLFSVNTTTGFSVGMMVAVDASSLVETTYNVGYVTAINTAAGGLTVDGRGLSFAPAAGHVVRGVLRSELGIGSRLNPYFTLLGVADFLNNGQVVHMFERVSPRGQTQERLIGTQHGMLQAAWDIHGYVSSRYNNTEENILGERLVFSGNTIQ